jgi:hypothetical protein
LKQLESGDEPAEFHTEGEGAAVFGWEALNPAVHTFQSSPNFRLLLLKHLFRISEAFWVYHEVELYQAYGPVAPSLYQGSLAATSATRVLALPPIAAGLERDMVDPGCVWPAANRLISSSEARSECPRDCL